MSSDSSFFNRVYQVVRQIPAGKVTTYGAIAAFVGSPGAARMVGWAVNRTFSMDEYLPAHRVLNRKGMLTGKHAFPGSETMQQLLESEGVKVENDQVVAFRDFFWDPAMELPSYNF